MKDNYVTETRIQDIPSIKDTLDNINNLSQVKAAWPLLRPVCKLLGIKVDQIDDAFTQVDELKVAAEEFASIPDRFNDLFASRGWIAYDLLNVDVAKAAIIKAEAGDIAGAEEDLINYYSPETVQWKLQMFSGISAFQPRIRLARLALEDYREGRFHACIPAVFPSLTFLKKYR